MERGKINRQDLPQLIEAIAKDARFFGPTETDRGVEFAEISDEQPLTLDFGNTKLSPKGLFFPQREVLCRFDTAGVSEESAPEEGNIVVFGMRPCDAKALGQLDMVFAGGEGRFADSYYLSRREQATILSLACNEPAETCFCLTTGGHPGGKEGSDALMYLLEDVLLIEAVTEKGKDFLAKHADLLENPTDAEIAEGQRIVDEAAKTVKKIDITGLKERLDEDFEGHVWDSITQNCLGCGTCTYLCPTCHCFDITDETRGDGSGVRVRSWDSCQYPLFTKHASGHNPRVNKKQRMRQRVMHKYAYSEDAYNQSFCVGCGRCVAYCPVNLDIREMIVTLNQG